MADCQWHRALFIDIRGARVAASFMERKGREGGGGGGGGGGKNKNKQHADKYNFTNNVQQPLPCMPLQQQQQEGAPPAVVVPVCPIKEKEKTGKLLPGNPVFEWH